MLAEETKITLDPFADATVERTYDLFGLVELNAWFCVTAKGQGKVPFNPEVHKAEQCTTAIDVYIQTLPEIEVKYPKTLEGHWVKWAKDWTKVTLPSIKHAFQAAYGRELGDLRELNSKWARVARVGYGDTYEKKDAQGNPTGEMVEKKTMRFVQFFDTEEECRAAYIAAGGKVDGNANGNGHNVPEMVVEDPAKATAATFLNAIVPNAVRGKATFADAQAAAKAIITQYAPVAAYFNETSPETLAIIKQVTGFEA